MRLLGVLLLLASLALAHKKPDTRQWVPGAVIGVKDRVVGSQMLATPGGRQGGIVGRPHADADTNIRSRDRVKTFTIIETKAYLMEVALARSVPVGAEVEVASDGKRVWVRYKGKETKSNATRMELKRER